MQRILIFGNSGAGKTTMARSISRRDGLVHLDLDSVAWSTPGVRKPVEESRASILRWIDEHPEWVMEGSYGDLLEVAVPYCTEMHFLNPGVDACVANCAARPWEPEKYASREDQDRMLDFLIAWVRDYESRSDEYSLTRHRAIYHAFDGVKSEHTSISLSPDLHP